MSDDTSRMPQAQTKRSHWRGWIWSVPLAALIIAAYFAIRTFLLAGPSATVTFPSADGISTDTPVQYRGVKVGSVSSVELGDKLNDVILHLSMDANMKQALRSGTLFWIEQPSLSLGNISQLMSGSYIGIQPGPGQPQDHFKGVLAPPQTTTPSGIEFGLQIPGTVSGLSAGAPVVIEGLKVGEVEKVGLEVSPAGSGISTPVTIDLYPRPFGLSPDAPPPAMYDLMSRLVDHGMRAHLASENLLFGSKEVALSIEPDARTAALDRNSQPPLIPTTGNNADINSIMASVGQITKNAESIPFKQIGQNLKDVSARIDQIATSPKIDRSLSSLDSTLANAKAITAKLQHEIGPILANIDQTSQNAKDISATAKKETGPILQEVHHTLDQMDSTIASLNKTVGGSMRQQNGLPDLVQELNRAARSVRELTDYLDRHPEALIRGRHPKQ